MWCSISIILVRTNIIGFAHLQLRMHILVRNICTYKMIVAACESEEEVVDKVHLTESFEAVEWSVVRLCVAM